MDTRFKERIELNAVIEKYQNEIDKLLVEAPELVSFQREVEARLDKVGDVRTVEGRLNRAALAFSMLRESFIKFRDGMEEYQRLLTVEFEANRNKTKLTVID
jgi:hypothetical protein